MLKPSQIKALNARPRRVVMRATEQPQHGWKLWLLPIIVGAILGLALLLAVWFCEEAEGAPLGVLGCCGLLRRGH